MKISRNFFVAALMCCGLVLAGAAAGCSSDEPEKKPAVTPGGQDEPAPEDDPMDDSHVVIAYVSAWSAVTPVPDFMTHINYAFGHVSETFNSVKVDNPDKLKSIAGLKKRNPRLKVLLSLGGWGSGGFSEMAADAALRKAFAADCRRVVNEFNLDGIDVDWEYPGSSAAGITSTPDDPANFVLLLKDIRDALAGVHLLTVASGATGSGMIFEDVLKYVDFVNIMSYDLADPPKHHAPLYKSKYSGYITADGCVAKHIQAGVPAGKLVLGVPFYGRGCGPYGYSEPFSKITVKPGCAERWDEDARVPYIVDAQGNFVLGFENARSITAKREYIKEKGLRGIMYWEYSQDTDANMLRRAAAGKLKVK